MRHFVSIAAFALAAAAAVPALGMQHAEHHAAGAPAASPSALTPGEVKKVDKEAGKLTIKHGPIASVDMPAMTMVFRVKDPAMLASVKPGDSIRFRVDKDQGSLTVVELHAAE